MIISSDVHTHTFFSDGENTPEEMIKRAIELGMKTIGISDHSPLNVQNDFAIPCEKFEAYIKEISDLKDKYRNQISVLLGIEMDSLSENDLKAFDYVIGSVHALSIKGTRYDVDETEDKLLYLINEMFSGDAASFYESFFKETVEMAKKIKPQIIGHFDLFTKYDENASTFPQTKEYIECALDTINTCIGYTEAFEVNTGAISRGYRKKPYPADFIIKHLKEKKVPIVLSSDAHSVSSIKQSFKETAQRLGALGVDSLYEYHKDGLCKINIR